MTTRMYLLLLLCCLSFFSIAQKVHLTGESKKWHTIDLICEGPNCSETDEYNPFLNYRLNVRFVHPSTKKEYVVPGYFAADGNAGQTGAKKGNIWKVHFTPDEIGEWNYSIEFSKGKWMAVRSRNWKVESAGYFDKASGTFFIEESDKMGNDFRAKGRLQYKGTRYLHFAETNDIFYKCGPDAPENFLSYYAFDGNFQYDGHKDQLVKKWSAHLSDWQLGDPTWGMNQRGKEIIGAVNYLASKGLNSISFITNNIKGDDQNVFPYIDYDTYDRFDCSKLDQWEMLFTHAQNKGLFLHFKTLEAENQGLLDNGGVGFQTKLYYRELIARFGHHLALNWNLCEEVGDWQKIDSQPSFPLDPEQRCVLTQYIYNLDPYHHHMVIHNGNWYTPMYGEKSKLTGASLQTNRADFGNVHNSVKKVLDEAEKAGQVWAVAIDEPGDAQHSLLPDIENPDHFNARTNGLWGAMLAGAWGSEWYFGYKHDHSDLTCEDYRSRDKFWDMGRICIDFFTSQKLPVGKMTCKDQLISSENDFCLAYEGDTYLVLLKNGGESTLDLGQSGGNFSVRWFNPRTGGELKKGKVKKLKGNGKHSLGLPPNEIEKDWVVLIQKEK